jgi:dienelactone hydrolase
MANLDRWRSAWLLGLALVLTAPAAAAEPGLQPEVRVEAPTRLDWEFVAAGFGSDSLRLPADYQSRDVRYQLFVPKDYHARKPWPLVVFTSPGDDPLGWATWEATCEAQGMFFCAAYGAGNNCPVGLRIRMVLDMFDDVRRRYAIDPDQTYFAGFSGGGRLACTLAFALTEYCGGVIAIAGTNPLNPLSYLRHRAQDRLSVALVTGADDFTRKEHEDYLAPLLTDLGIRSKAWVVPKLGHALPSPEVLAEVHGWLADDLKRRQADARSRPGLTVRPDEVPTALQQATRQVETAQAELNDPQRTWRAAALLQGVEARWGKTDASGKAILALESIQNDPKRAALLRQQHAADTQRVLSAQARAFERSGQRRRALETWEQLVRLHSGSPEAAHAAEQVKRLADVIAATPRRPYLGVTFTGDTTTVAQVVADGPADKAGIKPGDVVVRMGATRLRSLADLVKALARQKPGDRIALEVQRQGQKVALTLTIGSRAALGDD